MINLLPPEEKENVLYARRNTKLIRWVLALAVSAAAIMAVVVFGMLYLEQTTKAYNSQITETKAQLEAQKLTETQARISELSGNLKLTVDVLSKQILFSKLLRQIGAAIPSGTVLTDLNITKIQGGIELAFEAKDYQTATQVQLNLQDPNNKIFEKADLLEVNCSAEVPDGSVYPCDVRIRALFGNNSPYFFITKSGSTAQ